MNHPFFQHFKSAREKPVFSYERDQWFASIVELDEAEAECPTERRNREYREQQRAEARARRPLNRIWRAIQSLRGA